MSFRAIPIEDHYAGAYLPVHSNSGGGRPWIARDLLIDRRGLYNYDPIFDVQRFSDRTERGAVTTESQQLPANEYPLTARVNPDGTVTISHDPVTGQPITIAQEMLGGVDKKWIVIGVVALALWALSK